MAIFEQSLGMVFEPYTLLVILLAAIFGMFVGCIPGLSATMATALLVPITFFMEPVPAIAVIVTATAMIIFAGDIPAALLRMPGTPSSAAYVDEAYLMTKSGRADDALGAALVFSAIGGIFGSLVLMSVAPTLADIALKFSSDEYFWLVLLGLSCAVFVSPGSPAKGFISLLIGLFFATVGIGNPAGLPRFTFGNLELLGGISFIPAMVGLFAVSEVLRSVSETGTPITVGGSVKGGIFRTQWKNLKMYPTQIVRGNVVGTLIGALPGAGADIAAWISYAISKRFSKQRSKFGTGHVEGIVEAGASNNAAVSGAWIPALVFGIPGDSITAIVIGVLYVKGLNPGPAIFINEPASVYAIFMTFIVANLIMLPLGWLAIRGAKPLLSVPRNILMPTIMIFCIVGAFAINNTVFGVVLMLGFGILGFFMGENDIPVAPAILGLVLGPMLEQHFISTMIKHDGEILGFFERPIAAGLGIFTIAVWFFPVLLWVLSRRSKRKTVNAAAGEGG